MSRSAFVDLTTFTSSSSPNNSDGSGPQRSPCPSSPLISEPSRFHISADSHSSKRRRLNSGAAAGPSTLSSASISNSQHEPVIDFTEVDAIDLTESNGSAAFAHALSKQQEDAIKSQHSAKDETGRSLLTSYKCPVCMDTPVDATTTVCGMHFPYLVPTPGFFPCRMLD